MSLAANLTTLALITGNCCRFYDHGLIA